MTTPLELTPEDLMGDTDWEVSGQSPANSPQAILQTVEVLLAQAADPMSGIDKYKALEVFIRHSALKNAKVQIPHDELAQRIAAALAGQVSPGGGGVPGMVGPAGKDGTGGLPPSPVG